MSGLIGRKAVLIASSGNWPAGEKVTIRSILERGLLIENSAGKLGECCFGSVRMLREDEERNWKIFDIAEMPKEEVDVLLVMRDGNTKYDKWIDGRLSTWDEEFVEYYIPCSRIPRPKNIK